MRRILLIIVCLLSLASFAFAEEDPITGLKDMTLKFFSPVTGKITSVEGNKIVMDIGQKSGIMPGMRLNVLSEGEAFIHPVTKEMLGRVESATGKTEVKEAQAETSSGVLVEGKAKTGDKVRISGTKVKEHLGIDQLDGEFALLIDLRTRDVAAGETDDEAGKREQREQDGNR